MKVFCLLLSSDSSCYYSFLLQYPFMIIVSLSFGIILDLLYTRKQGKCVLSLSILGTDFLSRQQQQ